MPGPAFWRRSRGMSPPRPRGGGGRPVGGTAGRPPVIGRLNHVAIAVPDLAAAATRFGTTLGALVSAPRALPQHGVTVVFVSLPNSKVELLAPLGPDSPVAAFLRRHPDGGLHHICFEVDDLGAARDSLVAAGARVLGEGPRIGAHGRPVLFVHPKEFGGALIELEEADPAVPPNLDQ